MWKYFSGRTSSSTDTQMLLQQFFVDVGNQAHRNECFIFGETEKSHGIVISGNQKQFFQRTTLTAKGCFKTHNSFHDLTQQLSLDLLSV